jgi:hypothetical protein
MGLEFVHAAKAGNHPEIEQAAVARFQVLVSPYRSPAKLVEQILNLRLKSSVLAIARSTYSSPNTLRRIAIPRS